MPRGTHMLTNTALKSTSIQNMVWKINLMWRNGILLSIQVILCNIKLIFSVYIYGDAWWQALQLKHIVYMNITELNKCVVIEWYI